MLNLPSLFLAVITSSFLFGQQTIQEAAYLSFCKNTNHSDTFFIKNPSLNTSEWTKDQVGQTILFNKELINSENFTQKGAFIYFEATLNVKQADGLVLYFDEFTIPKGGLLYIQGNHSKKRFTYTSDDNQDGGSFSTLLVDGEVLSFIYQHPLNTLGPIFKLNEIGVINKQQKKTRRKKAFGSSGNCLLNVNCSEGNNWQDQKRAVVRILTKNNGALLQCSGTIMNNTNEDFTPYILTAEHCANKANTDIYSTTSDLDDWQFYFNYESSDCNNPASESDINFQTMIGATFVAQSHDRGGDNGSDFYLVKLKQNIPTSYCVHYSGWNRENTPALSGVTIHHPKFDIKKISTFTSPTVSDASINNVADTYWVTQWTATANGHSITESGSSGAPLFDQNKHFVGSLNGGNTACNKLNGYDWYGKLAYSWESNGTTANRQLKPHLDPTNSGVMTLNGKGSLATPQITISASATNVCDDETILFSITAQSNQGSAPTYQWFVNNILKSTATSYSSNELKNNDIVKAILTTSLNCVTSTQVESNTITMILKETFATAISIQTEEEIICTGTSAIFSISNQEGNGTYQWFKNNTPTVTTAQYTDNPTTNDEIKLVFTSTEECKTAAIATSNVITMTAQDDITPTITIAMATPLPICQDATVNFVATTAGKGTTGTIEWFKNDLTIANGNTVSLDNLNTNDSIRATLTSGLSCATATDTFSDTLKITTTVCTGISSLEELHDLIIFPNPFTDRIHIQGRNIKLITFRNTLGETLLITPYKQQIDCSSLPRGLYLLTVETNTQQKTLHFVKE